MLCFVFFLYCLISIFLLKFLIIRKWKKVEKKPAFHKKGRCRTNLTNQTNRTKVTKNVKQIVATSFILDKRNDGMELESELILESESVSMQMEEEVEE